MTISNRYDLIKPLGEGSFGDVWLAEDQTPGRQVALKLYKITGSGHKELVREFNQVYGLDSVNLVKAYHVDRDETQGISYLVMDYCRYGSLDQMIGQINEQEVWRCLRDIASGLVALSEHTVYDEKQRREIAAPVVHQDLKPANILIRKHDKDGHNVYAIADFGISKTSVSQKSGSSVFVSAGTLAYMGPERFFPDYRPRVESDIWSLGAMLYELVEGKTPFPTWDSLSGGNWLNQEGVELPKIENSAISSNLCNLIYSCMAKEPERRPTAKQLYNYSDKLLRHENCGDWEDVFKAKQSRKHEGGQSKYEKDHKNNRVSQPGKHNDETNKIHKGTTQKEKTVSKNVELLINCVLKGVLTKEEAFQHPYYIAATDEEQKYIQEQIRHKATPPTPKLKQKSIQKLNRLKNIRESAIYKQFRKLVPKYQNLILIAILMTILILIIVGQYHRDVNKNTSPVEPEAKEHISSVDEPRNEAVEVMPVSTNQKDTMWKSNNDLVFVVGGVEYKMIFVAGGSFNMGSGGTFHKEFYNEHKVILSNYYIGQTEVTNSLWKAVMGNNPSLNCSSSDCPVNSVSYTDITAFIKKLNALTGKMFRLPTEAEWEYAARGGRNSLGYKYSGSDDIYDVTSPRIDVVAQKRSNEIGLYDMSGNVEEWCADWYGDYSKSTQTNPKGAKSGSERVIRGGYSPGLDKDHLLTPLITCEVIARNSSIPDVGDQCRGFRLALTK